LIISITTEHDMRLTAIIDAIHSRMIKQGLDPRSLDESKAHYPSGMVIKKEIKNIVDGVLEIDEVEDLTTITVPVMNLVPFIDKRTGKTGTTMVVKTKDTVITVKKERLNPDNEPDREYLPRSKRPEWQLVCVLGPCKILNSNTTRNASWHKISGINDITSDYTTYFIH